MSKSNQILNRFMTVGATLLFTIQVLFSATPNNAEMSRRIHGLTKVIEIRVNEDVLDQVNFLVEHRRSDAETILGRTSMFFPTIERVLEANGIPSEMKYIAVIESSLIPFVKSRQGASGMWQFMAGTAELYGIHMDKYVDDRMDIERSTEIAAKYLKALYQKYNDWTLVLAAYNCGDGTVNKAIAKSGGITNYWSLRRFLPTETQRYLPRFIAAMYLDKYYNDHNLNPRIPSDLLTKTAKVKVYGKVDFKKVSKELDLDIDYIKFLNPKWRKEMIPQPADGGSHVLILPKETMYAYIDKYSSYEHLIDADDMVYASVDERQAAQELLAEIRKEVSIRQLKKYRNAGYAMRDSFKDELLIADMRNSMAFIEQADYALYQLKRKESLADVARNNNLDIEDLMALNGIKDESDLNPGSIIKIAK
jgi:Transglycosylase SLT domain/LysM domain